MPTTTSKELAEKYDILTVSDAKPFDLHFSLDSLNHLEEAEDKHFWHISRKYLIKKLIRRYRKKHEEIADIGCGNGSVIKNLSQEFSHSQFTGIDGYLEALINCRRRSSSAILQLQDINNLQSIPEGKKYDVVMLLDVLEHLDHPKKVIEKLDAILNPNGIVIATVPAFMGLWSVRDVFLGHRKRYLRKEFSSLFKGDGLTILHSNYLFSYLYLPTVFFRKVFSKANNTTGKDIEKAELKVVPIINSLMILIGKIECLISLYMPLPFGTTTYCIAKKKNG